ncbi:hypothetical protein [Microbacterium murale]|uniref:Uncharacterized protein n=1 Tax=Microbacterium murale TaxID=1081040 RepID=A0ABQ1RT72_9MICO|nr:hypothetical protein [Microbacterium murale]GGD76532.1 hypothetical protein GCM10007269_19370 [Microbacterium murale]
MSLPESNVTLDDEETALRNIDLGEGEALVEDASELIFRQITKHSLSKDGRVGTHAFGQADSDRGKPSYSRRSVVSAQEARDWHNANARTQSLAVWALALEEVFAERLWAIDDSAAPVEEGKVRAPGHCYVDYRHLSRGEVKSIRARLYFAAERRGEIPTTSEVIGDGLIDLAEVG